MILKIRLMLIFHLWKMNRSRIELYFLLAIVLSAVFGTVTIRFCLCTCCLIRLDVWGLFGELSVCDENELLKKALAYVLSLVAKREYSVFDIKEKLSAKFGADIADSAVEYAVEHKYVSDERYAEMFARYRANNHYGPEKIFNDLKLKYIDESIISNALENCDISFEDKISEYFSSKFDESELADAKYRAKVYRTLIGRGYTNDQVRDIIDR